jgi:hypothetical protein
MDNIEHNREADRDRDIEQVRQDGLGSHLVMLYIHELFLLCDNDSISPEHVKLSMSGEYNSFRQA